MYLKIPCVETVNQIHVLYTSVDNILLLIKMYYYIWQPATVLLM